MCDRDYERKDELDRYERDGIDDDEQEELDYNDRREVERRLNEEAKYRQRNKSRIPGAFMDDENEFSEEDEL